MVSGSPKHLPVRNLKRNQHTDVPTGILEHDAKVERDYCLLRPGLQILPRARAAVISRRREHPDQRQALLFSPLFRSRSLRQVARLTGTAEPNPFAWTPGSAWIADALSRRTGRGTTAKGITGTAPERNGIYRRVVTQARLRTRRTNHVGAGSAMVLRDAAGVPTISANV